MSTLKYCKFDEDLYITVAGHFVWRERDSRGLFMMRKSVTDASLAATEWMEFIAKREGISIQHMFNGK